MSNQQEFQNPDKPRNDGLTLIFTRAVQGLGAGTVAFIGLSLLVGPPPAALLVPALLKICALGGLLGAGYGAYEASQIIKRPYNAKENGPAPRA